MGEAVCADAGEVRVAGLDVRDDAAQLRTRIGLAGQYAAVDENLTGRENLRLIGKLDLLSAFAVRLFQPVNHFEVVSAGNRAQLAVVARGKPGCLVTGGLARKLGRLFAAPGNPDRCRAGAHAKHG